MGIAENKAILERFDRLTGSGEVDSLNEICTAHMINHALASHRSPGLEGTKEFLRECARDLGKAAWRRTMILDQDVVAIGEGDYIVQYGTRKGTWPGGRFRGIDIRAGDFQYAVAFMYRFEDGLIAERWALRDDLAMILQLNGDLAQTETLSVGPRPWWVSSALNAAQRCSTEAGSL
jgi:predicted ester cyclase